MLSLSLYAKKRRLTDLHREMSCSKTSKIAATKDPTDGGKSRAQIASVAVATRAESVGPMARLRIGLHLVACKTREREETEDEMIVGSAMGTQDRLVDHLAKRHQHLTTHLRQTGIARRRGVDRREMGERIADVVVAVEVG